ncbi:MAG TPA: translocation/assembly module TamB domain-containing protein [Bryobacteraceae bacterium]|nr:translocation/assembly module TamB domain-containing protein [Bryobacteraceae bacterium]
MTKVISNVRRLLCGVALGVIIAITAAFVLRSEWFKEKVRQQIIASVEHASGGRVELGAFSYNWRTLSATFQNFVIHGTEPASGPPLFHADLIEVQMHIISVLEGKVEMSSIVIERPNIYLLVRDDKSTNIPTPNVDRKTVERTVYDLLNLRLRHFEARHGSIRTALQQLSLPFNLRGEEVALRVGYSNQAPSYVAQISSREFAISSKSFQRLAMKLSARARLEKDRLILESSNFSSETSKIRATGIVENFNRPVVDLQLNADLASSDVARIAGVPELRSGRIGFVGTLRRDAENPVTLSGKLAAHQISIQLKDYALKNCDLTSEIAASPDRLSFSGIRFRAPWGQLAGDASVLSNGAFSFAGHLAAVNVVAIERFLFRTELPWQGVATGALAMNGTLAKSPRDFVIQTKLNIDSPSGSETASGHIEAAYHQRGNTIDLANVQLNLPHTRLAISGRVNDNLNTVIDTTDLHDLQPLQSERVAANLPDLLSDGSAHFNGTITGPVNHPRVNGDVSLNRFRAFGETWDHVRAHAELSADAAVFTGLSIDQSSMHASGTAHLSLTNWAADRKAAAAIELQFRGAGVARFAKVAHLPSVHLSGGSASGSLNLNGSLDNPQGTAQIRVQDLCAFNQCFDRAGADLRLLPGEIRLMNGQLQAGSASVAFSGNYLHPSSDWRSGQLHIKADSNAFPLTTVAAARQHEPGWNAQLELHGDIGVKFESGHIEPTVANGVLVLRHVTQANETLGDVTLDASTKGSLLYAGFSGDLRDTHVKGNAEIQLTPGRPVKGQLQVDRIGLQTLYALLNTGGFQALPLDGSVRGNMTFDGLLLEPEHMRGIIHVDDLQIGAAALLHSATRISAPTLVFRNSGPITLEAANGRLELRNFQLTGPETNLALKGFVEYLHQPSLDLKANGTLDLKILQLFQPSIQSSGRSAIAVSIIGTPAKPAINGAVEIQNGTLFANGFPNGLTGINGTFRFDRSRATIQKLTAQTGGGTVSASGFIDLSADQQPVYRLDAATENVRIRYANSISVTATSQLRLTGTSKSSVLSGTATISRVVFTPNADVGTLLATAAASSAAPSEEHGFFAGLQLDVRVESAPDLQVTTELSRDIQAEIDLRLRGTPGHPVLLGDIVANQGDIKVFGGKYSVNRGEIRFVNAARIDPVLDLDLQTETRGITVDITIAGTLGKLNINYRSDPPLQPRDIIALLTVGRAPDTGAINANLQTSSDTSAMQYGANTVVGQAIAPVSNRLSKLFGITNIKIDPLVQNITNAPQARLTLEQQVSREITVTYVTNLSQTSEQIFRLEWAFSPQYSLIALRDDNGEFGIDIQYKKRFK